MSLLLDIGGKSIGEFLALFILGYIVLSEDIIQEKLENNRIANELIFRGTKKKEEILKASS